MLSGRADSGESRMREICMSGSTRERGAAVIDAIVFHSVLSSLLYRLNPPHFISPLDHGLPRAATPQPKLPLLHRMEERVGRGGSFETEETLGMPLPMNHPSPGLRPPSPRKAGRGQGEGRPARGSRAQGAIKVRGVLSSVLSPLLRRGERKKKTALRKIVAGRDDSFL